MSYNKNVSQETDGYRQTLSNLLKSETSHHARRTFLEEMKHDSQYQQARSARVAERRVLLDQRKPLSAGPDSATFRSTDVITQLREKQQRASLSPQEERTLWGYQIQQEFDALPKEGNAQIRRRQRKFLDDVADQLFVDSERIGIVSGIWSLQKETDEKLSLYALITERLRKKMRGEWSGRGKGLLSKLVTLYVYSPFAKEMIFEAMKGYFQALDSPPKVAQGMYNFADAAFEVVNDPLALEQIVKILSFDTDWVPRGSSVWMDFVEARTTIDNDTVLQKAYIADNMALRLAELTSLDPDELRRRNHEHRDSEKVLQLRLDRYGERMAMRLGQKTAQDKFDTLTAADKIVTTVSLEPNQAYEYYTTWPLNLITDPTDPVLQKYTQLVGSKVEAKKYRRDVERAFRDEGFTQTTSFALFFPNGIIVEVCTAGNLDAEQRAAILRDINRHHTQEELLEHLERYQRTPAATTVIASFLGRIDGQLYHIAARRLCVIEQNIHPLNTLETIGIPLPPLEPNENLDQVIHNLHEKILKEKSRYLNTRGFRVPFRQSEFTRLGYRSLVYRKGADNSTRVALQVNGTTFTFHLDRYFNLDLREQIIQSPLIEQGLQYFLYSTLYPLLCERDGNGHNGPESYDGLEVVSRVGHLRFLPDGQHFTSDAYLNCLAETGDDLFVVTTQRQLDHQTDRVTTYVSPVIEVADNLAPIEVNIRIPRFN